MGTAWETQVSSLEAGLGIEGWVGDFGTNFISKSSGGAGRDLAVTRDTVARILLWGHHISGANPVSATGRSENLMVCEVWVNSLGGVILSVARVRPRGGVRTELQGPVPGLHLMRGPGQLPSC